MIETRHSVRDILSLTKFHATYERAVAWVAQEDNNGHEERLDAGALSGYLTVCLIADLFGKEQGEVAHDVITLRRRMDNAATPRRTSVKRAREVV